MNLQLLRVLAAVPGVPMLINGVGFITDPATVAATLGMRLLDGVGLSTQIGDFGAFFLAIAGFIFYGAFTAKSTWLKAAAVLLALAAVLRVTAWLAHGADFAGLFIAVEVILATWLLICAYQFDRKASAG
ncbi:MAG: hypothetical protein ACI8PP_000330 [Candidatus Pseudothioglobus sp.]|jgi:hypothetical protein